jgi:formimidoylglutamate deiminase
MSTPEIIEADWTWTGDRFESGIQITVDAGGRIHELGRGRAPTRRLEHAALIPGFVNAHSHAFQRGLRGLGERFPAGAGSFWSWREAMYGLVESLDAATLSRLCTQAFGEMLDAGITTVGEFHYLHHATEKSDYEFDRVVLLAAAAVGIRIVLLNAYYTTGGIGQPLGGAQRRFGSVDPNVYWKQMDRLKDALDPTTQTLGVVAHSIRAATVEDISSLHAEAQRRGLVFHKHLEEQRREVQECLEAYGRRPMQILNDTLEIDGNLTAVHCTHTLPEDLAEFLRAGGTVCVCPLTEANLGDGVPSLVPIGLIQGSLSLGTDSNARISMLEEMRWLEYGQRLRSETRGVLTDGEGQVARTVLHAATAGGARALGLQTGRLQAGNWADIAVIDLGHPALAGCDPDHLVEAVVFGTDNDVILGTYVGGTWRERGVAPPAGLQAVPNRQWSAATFLRP